MGAILGCEVNGLQFWGGGLFRLNAGFVFDVGG